jgi:predicted Zn finger-like uncharacterized protein
MLIRCQRCQAVFSLQDGVAASGASFKVECGRCLQVFEAVAPKRALVGAQGNTPLQMPRVPARKPEPPAAVERKSATPRSPPPFPAELAKALKPRRPPDDGVFERELLRVVTWRRRRIQMAIAVVSGLAVLVAATQWRRFAGLPREAEMRIEKARQKLLRDDLQSLEEAAALFTEAARIAPGEALPKAERAYALLLQAATHKDLADRLESAEREPHVRSANKLLQDGLAAAKAAIEEDGADPVAMRAMALYCALANAPERGLRYLDAAEKKGRPSALNAYTRAVLTLSGTPSRERQDRALASLALARQTEPRLLRAQVVAGAVSLDRKEPGPAREALSKVLEQNPQHERARRLLALLPAAP